MTDSSLFDLKDNTQLYRVLGVEKTATEAEIRRAYKRLAVLYHPDKNPDGADTFKEINFAHTILSDPEQRRMYDSKTLRTHIDGKAKAYDPAMDPNVELTADQMRDFVERLRNEQAEAESKKDAFDRRREEEMRRREEYDSRNPGFSMPSASSIPKSSVEVEYRQQQATTAEMMERLASLQKAPDVEEDPLAGLRGTNCSSTFKSQMLNSFRNARREQGKTTVEDTMPEPKTMVDTSSSKYQFVAQNPTSNYSSSTRQNVQRRRDFNYCEFVARDLVDGGVVKDAIMADALGDYDPNN
jgi:curved DNA-binding protein CbpA